jgi:dihydroneopterin aldolase
MRFHAVVGILPHERDFAQPIEVDLIVMVTPGNGVVDYAKLYAGVAGVLSSGAIDFLEQVASRIIDSAFGVSDRIQSVRVAVRKPHVALAGPLDYAEVSMSRGIEDESDGAGAAGAHGTHG